MKSSTLRIQTLPIKDLNYEELPLTLKIQQTIKSIKRNKIIESFKKNVSINYN